MEKKELKTLADKRGDTIVPSQEGFDDNSAKKVKVKSKKVK